MEEELMLLAPETFALVGGVERLLGPPGLKTELFACVVETNTNVCGSAPEALAELVRLRGLVAAAAEREGLLVAATGAHPFSQPEEQEIVPEPRYLAMLAERPKARRQLVCGLHVHVGMGSFDACLATLEAILPWLPAVLALSLNSPYLRPTAPGILSGRAGRLLELPRAGPPPPLPDRETWERVVAPIGDYTKIWWDVRPHPRLGTLEIRTPDQQTDVRRSAAFAGLLQALCAAARPPRDGPYDRGEYLRARGLATSGVAAKEHLLALVEPASRELGSWELVELLWQPQEAHRQLEVGARDGLRAVAADLVERSRVYDSARGDADGDDRGERDPLRALRRATGGGAQGARGARGGERDPDGAGPPLVGRDEDLA